MAKDRLMRDFCSHRDIYWDVTEVSYTIYPSTSRIFQKQVLNFKLQTCERPLPFIHQRSKSHQFRFSTLDVRPWTLDVLLVEAEAFVAMPYNTESAILLPGFREIGIASVLDDNTRMAGYQFRLKSKF